VRAEIGLQGPETWPTPAPVFNPPARLTVSGDVYGGPNWKPTVGQNLRPNQQPR